MNVLVESSKKYFPYLTVMLTSLFENNPNNRITVFVIHSELSESDFQLLNVLAEKYQNQILPIEINAEKLAGLPTQSRLPMVLFYRLMAVDVLPKSIDRILSLDIDIIVQNPLNELYETELENYYLAACEDQLANTARYKKSLHLPENQIYFNAGMFVLNLKKTRQDGIGLNTFLKAEQHQEHQLTVPDQDLLNIVLGKKLKLFDAACYNCSPAMYKQSYGSNLADNKHFAAVLHYLMADRKPWNTHVADIDSDLENLWWSYAKKTPYYSHLKSEFDQKIAAKLAKENIALKEYYEIALKWLQVENRKAKLVNFLLSRNIHSISIYGLNKFQEILCNDLKDSPINIAYLIDTYAKGYSHGFEIRNGSQFEDIDAIIVAACAHFCEIRSGIDSDCPVISLDEIITAIYKM